MSRAVFAVAAVVIATSCAREPAREAGPLSACLDSAGRLGGDSARVAAAVARCDSLAPAAAGSVRVIGVITDRPRADSGRH